MSRRSSLTRCEPRWATARSPNRATFGTAIGIVAEKIGLPLMPWQQLVADVGGEIDPDTGLPAYREVIVTVPRQSGKTTLVLSWEVQRALGWEGPQRLVYSAQSGSDARKKLIEDQFPILEPRKRVLGINRLLRGMGNEGIEWANGSRLVLLASTEESGHGKTVDLAVKDELFADYDDRRDQALIPAMATRHAAQVLTTSTMGTDESVALNKAVERGRAAVDADKRSGIAYFEWSADPSADPSDPAVWWSCMPALGITVPEHVVQHAFDTMSLGEFCRAFLNISTKADNRVIPLVAWEAICSADVAPSGQITIGIDANPERTAASIVAAGLDGNDEPVVELIKHAPSIGWVVARAKELDTKWDGPEFVIDSTGPAATLIPELEREGLKVRALKASELVTSCGQFFDDVMEGHIRLRQHERFDVAAAGAVKRQVGDAWAWTRRNALVDVSPLVAATIASWVARQNAGNYEMATMPAPTGDTGIFGARGRLNL